MKKNQNANVKRVRCVVGIDSKGKKITALCDIETTNTQLIIWNGSEVVGRAGVQRKEDFDYDALLRIAQQQVAVSA